MLHNRIKPASSILNASFDYSFHPQHLQSFIFATFILIMDRLWNTPCILSPHSFHREYSFILYYLLPLTVHRLCFKLPTSSELIGFGCQVSFRQHSRAHRIVSASAVNIPCVTILRAPRLRSWRSIVSASSTIIGFGCSFIMSQRAKRRYQEDNLESRNSENKRRCWDKRNAVKVKNSIWSANIVK